ncbi:MAG: ABC transporter ATP-binding protein [Trueperaceae bacterium]|nr:ABC transporter ATP-binding protein [Trueperaceae bacterium]
MTLRIKSLTKRYGRTLAVDSVTVEIAPAETLALLGPSGCGKSTLLRLIAGLEPPDEGRVLMENRDLSGVSPQNRNIGMVFQDYALFPHLDVGRNVAFGLVELGVPRDDQQRRVGELLELVGLSGSERRRIHELSGGQQQRVALARALAPEPEVLLLDEPLSNLDQALRETLKVELKMILRQLKVRAIYVTHDQSEAVTMGQRVAVMRQGRLEQIATTDRLREAPKNVWLAQFLGHPNIFSEQSLSNATGIQVQGPAILRTDLISLGGNVAAEVLSYENQGSLIQIELLIPSWGLSVQWEGFAREVPSNIYPGKSVSLHIPDDAWVELGRK